MFGAQVLRRTESILSETERLLEQHNGSCPALLAECARAAICRVPTRAKKFGQDEEEAEAENRGGGCTLWTVAMANTIGKLYVKLFLAVISQYFYCADLTDLSAPRTVRKGRHLSSMTASSNTMSHGVRETSAGRVASARPMAALFLRRMEA